jgi:hypothetical protein
MPPGAEKLIQNLPSISKWRKKEYIDRRRRACRKKGSSRIFFARAQSPGLLEILEDEYTEVYSTGDCKEPRRLLNAIYEGSVLGRRV